MAAYLGKVGSDQRHEWWTTVVQPLWELADVLDFGPAPGGHHVWMNLPLLSVDLHDYWTQLKLTAQALGEYYGLDIHYLTFMDRLDKAQELVQQLREEAAVDLAGDEPVEVEVVTPPSSRRESSNGSKGNSRAPVQDRGAAGGGSAAEDKDGPKEEGPRSRWLQRGLYAVALLGFAEALRRARRR